MGSMRNRMVAHNRAKSTISGYVYGAKQLSLYSNKPFSSIESDDIYAFLAYLREERGLSRDTMRIAACGIKYLYKHFFRKEDIVKDIPYPKKEKYLPEILNSTELKRLFDRTQNIKHRAFLKLVYSSGLRRSEACNLLITDIDSKNMQVRINKGKGKKGRYTILSYDALKELRTYIKTKKPEYYLFNGKKKGTHISEESTSWIMNKAISRSGITKEISLHNLRHSFASHLLSTGVNLLTIQKLLGHEDIRTTMIYLHISNLISKPINSPLDFIYPPAKK